MGSGNDPDGHAPTAPPGRSEREGSPEAVDHAEAGAAGALAPGALIAERYRVEALLGSGGMGSVYRASHVHMRKRVAIKVLHREMTLVPEMVARFEREAIASAHVQHPNVVAASDFGRLADGSFYLVLEYVDGLSLRHLLDEAGRLPLDRAVAVARQIADALGAAHSAGIVHRDLKPDNVMLVARAGAADMVKVLDFGIAQVRRTETRDGPALTQLGAVFGTPDYMSPEQALGQPVDHRSDLYALGVILYEMLAGQPPFASEDPLTTLARHMTATAPPLPADVPRAASLLVDTLLAKRPRDRPSDAAAVGQALARLAGIEAPGGDVATPRNGGASIATISRALHPLLVRGAAAATPWVVATRRHLIRPVTVGRWTLPTFTLVMPAAAAFVVLLALALAPDRRERLRLELPSTSSSPPSAAATAPPPPTNREALAARAEIDRIQGVLLYKRTTDDWLALGRAHAALGEANASVSAFRQALSKSPAQAKNPEIIAHFRAAARDDDARRQLYVLCGTVLGRPGIDLLYQIWLDLREDPLRLGAAEETLAKLVILSHRGTPAVRVAIDLETARCPALAQVVERARREADTRSSARLRALGAATGCGAGERGDCWPCLRGSAGLAEALERSRARSAPTLGDARPD